VPPSPTGSPTWNAFRLAPTHETGASVPVHGFPQFVVALAEVDTLYRDAAANAVDDRVGALQPGPPRSLALRDAGVTPGGFLVGLDHLLAMMPTELLRLCEFASPLRSGRLVWRQEASDSKVRSQER
jgi:hypothetical protein